MTTMYKQFGGTTTRDDGSDDEDYEGDWESDTELPFSETTGVCMRSSQYNCIMSVKVWQKT